MTLNGRVVDWQVKRQSLNPYRVESLLGLICEALKNY